MKQFISIIILFALSLNIQGQTITFSYERGYYNAPISLDLSTDIQGATIRYAINGQEISVTTGQIYNNPISVTTTTTVKAIAYNSADTSTVFAHTYIYINDVIQQPNSTPGFPVGTGISNSIQNDPVYGPLLDDALTAIPVVCLSLKQSDYSFIYSNKGILKSGNVEFFDVTNGESYSLPTGIMVYGNSSFGAASANKKNYRFKFREEFGATKWKFPLFGEDAADEFDVFDLRAGGQETLDRGGVQNMHEKILKDWQIKMSGNGVHGRFAHVYINAVYWGVYTISERPEKSFGESYYSGSKDDYNTIKTTCCSSVPAAIDGTVDSYNYMITQAGNYPAIEQYLDVEQFIDWVILCNYGPHGDWTYWNTYVIGNPTANEPYRFFMWDPEPSFDNDWYYTNKLVNTNHWEDLWQPLKANADFRMRVADRFECNCIEPDGPLNPINAENYYKEVFDAHSLAYLAECARWADNLYDDFLQYRQDLVSSGWFYNRLASVKTAYKNNNLYPSIDAVQSNIPGGEVSIGTQITLSNPNNGGTIYYTIDGTDPRAPGGSISATAQVYTGSISLAQGVVEIKARVKNGSTWSATCPKRYYVGLDYSQLVINEIMYHPSDTCNIYDTEMDYIEIHNPGIADVNLTDTKFASGITYTFPFGTSIAAGDYMVLAENADTFNLHYGFLPDAQYAGSLSNDGEKLVWKDFKDLTIDSVKYNDANPWDEDPDGNGPSLELLNPLFDNSDPINWFRSDGICGTPKAANSRVCNNLAQPIVINEINYNSNNNLNDPGDWVELHNPNAATVDLSGWTFYDNNNEFVIPTGTTLEGGEFLVLVENTTMFSSVFPNVPANNTLGNFVFGLSNKGERVSLFDQNKCLSDYVIYNDRLPWDTIPDGNGPSLSLTAPNLDNTLPNSWEASSNIGAPYGTPGRANVPCPTVTFNVPATVCKDESILMYATSTGVVDYTWTIQGGNPAAATTDSVYSTFSNPGLAFVELEATYFECAINLSQLVTVQTCNTPPVPQPDNYSVNEDNTLTNNVLSNDSDPEGQTMTATVITGVSNGNLNLNANGSFTYTPNTNYFGSDAFTYQVCDNASPALCANESVSITVNSVNDAPVANSDLFSTNEDTQVTGNVLTNDSDIDGNTLSASVSTTTSNGTLTLQPNGSFTYTPNANYFGSDQFVYEVCDSGSPSICLTENVTISISPVNDAPTATADNLTINEDSSGGGNVLTNDSDIENQPLTSTISSNVSNGTLTLNPNGTYTYVPNANFNGSDNFTYQVCDNAPTPLCDTETVTITVTSVNDAPSTNSDLFSTNEDTQVTGNVLTNDSDIDGNTLSASVSTTTSNGTLTLQPNGSFTYTPNANYFGSDQFVYEVCDNGSPSICLTENVTISISPINDAPTATADNLTINEDSSGGGNVLTNDSDIENQPLTSTISSNVSNGTLTLNSNGTYTYVPNANFNGSDSFTYQVCDNAPTPLCDSETVTITVTSVNDAPSTNSDLYTMQEDTLITGDVLTNDSDVDGNTLTTTINTTTSNGTLTLQQNGNFTYTPSANYFGTDQFVYQVCDDGSPSICLTENVTISISPVNDAPNSTQDNYTIPEDSTLTNNVLVNDSDIENNTLSVTIISNVSNGNLSLNGNGNFTYVPNQNYFGSDNFFYEVCDNGSPSLCETEIVNIIINGVNDAPSSTIDSFLGNEDNQITGNVLSNDSDADGNNLTASIQTVPSNGTILLLANGSFTYDPTANYFGKDTLTYQVCDDGNPILCRIETVIFTIAAVDDAPIATADNFNIKEDSSLSNNVLSNDIEVENQPITSQLIVDCTNGTLSLNSNGSFNYVPNLNFFGVDSFLYEVCDDSSPAMCAQETATINIQSVNDQPIVRNDTVSTNEGIQVAGNASTNDYDVETNPMSYILLAFTQNGSVLFNFDGSFYYTPFAGYSGIDSFQYRVCDNGTPNYCETATVYINVIPDCVALDLALYLEGAYNTQTGQMNTTLNTSRAILPGMTGNPVTGQPYNNPPWNYQGTEGLGWTDADYDSTVVDWVLVSLRTDVTQVTEVHRLAGLLHSDGAISFVGECLTASELSGSYHIVVEHRNHMAVMSPSKVSVINRTLSWDFRQADSYAVGGSGAKELTPGIWALYAGDCNQIDDVVSYDINGKDKSSWLLDNGNFGVYLDTDMNMNGDVNGSDKALWLLNNGVFGSVKK